MVHGLLVLQHFVSWTAHGICPDSVFLSLCISVWLFCPALFCLAIGQISFYYQLVKAAHIHSTQSSSHSSLVSFQVCTLFICSFLLPLLYLVFLATPCILEESVFNLTSLGRVFLLVWSLKHMPVHPLISFNLPNKDPISSPNCLSPMLTGHLIHWKF